MRRDDLLDLNEVLQHPGRMISVEVSTEFETEEDLDLLQPLDGELHAVSTGNILLITGSFRTVAVLECSRCSHPVEVAVSFELDENFPVEGTPSSLNAQDMARVVPEEDFPLFEGNHLMVEALLRQSLLVSLPLHVECPEGTCAYEPTHEADSSGRPEFQQLADKLKDPGGTK